MQRLFFLYQRRGGGSIVNMSNDVIFHVVMWRYLQFSAIKDWVYLTSAKKSNCYLTSDYFQFLWHDVFTDVPSFLILDSCFINDYKFITQRNGRKYFILRQTPLFIRWYHNDSFEFRSKKLLRCMVLVVSEFIERTLI